MASEEIEYDLHPLMGCLVSTVGIGFFTLLYQIFKRLFSVLYRTEPLYVHSDIAVKTVTAIQAVMASVSGFVIATSCNDKIMEDRHWLTSRYAWFGVTYFYYDFCAMMTTHVLKNPSLARSGWWTETRHFVRHNRLMTFHHVALPLLLFPPTVWLRKGQGDFFIGCLYMMELAVPFISLRQVHVTLRQTRTHFYLANGLVMMLIFFLCRCCMLPFLYWYYGRRYSIPLLSVPSSIPVKCNFFSAMVMSLMVYWQLLMVRGLLRYCRKGSDQGGGPVKEACAKGAKNGHAL